MSYLSYIRRRVGRRKIFLAFASVVLRDEQERILLQYRKDFNTWGLPGGILEVGESILDCARRELLEETGLTAGDLRLKGVYTDPRWECIYPNGDQVEQFTICFEGTALGGQMRVDGVENSAQAFFTPQEIPWEKLPPWYAAMLSDLPLHPELLFRSDSLPNCEPRFDPPFALPQTSSHIDWLRQFVGHDLIIGVGGVGVVTDGAGHWLLARRTDDGNWHFPGGYMNHGENVAYTVVREIREETGLEVALERLMGVFSPTRPWLYPNGDKVQSIGCYFRAHVVGGALQADLVETRQLAWLTPEETGALEFHPIMTPVIHAILAHLEDGYFLL